VCVCVCVCVYVYVCARMCESMLERAYVSLCISMKASMIV
jgi:hypothetical protein